MKELNFVASKPQFNALRSIAYWRAELAYASERDFEEVPCCRENVEYNLALADKLAVPFWCQNVALALGENWRTYEKHYFDAWMKARNITC